MSEIKSKLTRPSLLPLWIGMCLLFVGAGGLVFFGAKYQNSKEEGFVTHYANFEEQRLVSHFNYRLNQLRDELLALNIEQTVLSRAIGDKEKEKIIFQDRDSLHAFGLIVYTDENNGAGKSKSLQWQIQKQYLKEAIKPNQNNLLEVFRLAAASIQPPGFFLKRTQGITGFDSFLVAFTNKDDSGKVYAVAGLYSSQYLFPFCRYFTDSLGTKAVSSFVMSAEDGVVLCHSNKKFEGTVFKEGSAFAQGQTLMEKDLANFEYRNASMVPVAATIRKIKTGDLYLVGEVEKSGGILSSLLDWIQAEPGLIISLGSIFAVLLTLSLYTFFQTKRWERQVVADEAFLEENLEKVLDQPILSEQNLVHEPSLGSLQLIKSNNPESSSDAIRDLENTVLDMQSTMAFLVGFHQEALALPLEQSFSDFVVRYLAGDSLITAWFEFEGDKYLRLKSHQGIAEVKESFYKEYGYRLAVPQTFRPEDFDIQPFIEPVKDFIGANRIVLTPVSFQDKWIALLAVGESGQGSDCRNYEILPYVSQICASALLIRDCVKNHQVSTT